MIIAEYLPSKLNVMADQGSRRKIDSSEWMLNPKVFHSICQKIVTPQIELFTSRFSYQLTTYVLRKPDPFSFRTDAFQLNWSGKIIDVFLFSL